MFRVLTSLLFRVRKISGHTHWKVGLLMVAIVAYATSGFMYFELEQKPDLTWGDAFWWSIVTMTTVGYGDFFPSSVGGRLWVGIPVMIFGISVLGYLLSIIATFLIEARSRELKGMSDLRVGGHTLIIHYSGEERFAGVLRELHSDPSTREVPVVLIDDRLEELPRGLRERNVKFVAGDPTKESVLERAAFRKAKNAIILARDPHDPRSDHDNLAVSLTIEQLRPEIHTVAECVDPERIALLKRAGCDSVVCLAEMTSALLVTESVDPGTQQVLQDLASKDGGHQLYFVPVERLVTWRYGEVQSLLMEQGALALGLRREGEVELHPKAVREVVRGDVAICLAESRPDAIFV